MRIQITRGSESQAGLDIADIVMLMVVTVWAGNNVLTKSALGESISPRVYVLLRLLIVTILLFGILAMRRQRIAIQRSDIGIFLLAGVSGYAAYNLLFVLGLART